MKRLYAMYKQIDAHCYSDDGGGTDSTRILLAVDVSIADLRRRWNISKEKGQPEFKHGTELNFNGGSGGGYASVNCKVYIEPLQQFDGCDGIERGTTDYIDEIQIRNSVFAELAESIWRAIERTKVTQDDCGNFTISSTRIKDYESASTVWYWLSNQFDEFERAAWKTRLAHIEQRTETTDN